MKFLIPTAFLVAAASAFTIPSTGKLTSNTALNAKPFFYPPPGENDSPLNQWWNAPYGSSENSQDIFRGGRAKQGEAAPPNTTRELIQDAYPYEFVPKNSQATKYDELSESRANAKEWSARAQYPPKMGVNDFLDYDNK